MPPILVSTENLVVSNNFLAKQIPDVFQNLNRLNYMDVSNNLFTGTIPLSIFQTRSIRILYFSNNTLSGTIPTEYSQPLFLTNLFLDGNVLTGTVPGIASGQLQQLTELLLEFNFLNGTMPSSICSLRGGGGMLAALFSDCGGSSPQIFCEYPSCCNRCFEGGGVTKA
jgi:Leucine-rich repeat (LRR) protein